MATDPPLHPGLSLDLLEQLPFSVRRVATAAAQGSLEHLQRLEKSFLTGPESQSHLLIPAFYANLDPKKIPSADTLDSESPPETVVSILTGAYISLNVLKEPRRVPLAALPQLWPCVWQWIDLLATYHYCLSSDLNLGKTKILLELFSLVALFRTNSSTARAVDLTPGVHIFVAKAWRVIVDRAYEGDTSGMPSLCAIIRAHKTLHDEGYTVVLDELVDGTGGSLANLAVLVVDHINLARENPKQHPLFLRSALIFLKMECRTLFWSPELLSAGIVKALINVACAVGKTRVDGIEGIRTLDMCFETLHQTLSCDTHRTIKALKAGFLRAIVSGSSIDLDLMEVDQLLRYLLPAVTTNYYILRQMRISLAKVGDVIATTKFSSEKLNNWRDFKNVVAMRGEILDLVDSDNSAPRRACDYAECSMIGEKINFRRCAGCKHQWYCSDKCQLGEWQLGSHRSLCGEYAKNHNLLRRPERKFLRALLDADYVRSKQDIALLQVEFIVQHPGEPFYTCFDYTSVSPEISVRSIRSSWGGDPLKPIPYRVDQGARAARSGGRLAPHVAVTDSEWVWIPLRSSSGVLGEGVRELANQLRGTVDIAPLRPSLRLKIAALDTETQACVEFH